MIKFSIRLHLTLLAVFFTAQAVALSNPRVGHTVPQLRVLSWLPAHTAFCIPVTSLWPQVPHTHSSLSPFQLDRPLRCSANTQGCSCLRTLVKVVPSTWITLPSVTDTANRSLRVLALMSLTQKASPSGPSRLSTYPPPPATTSRPFVLLCSLWH